jgi:hypothetical protein
MRVSGLETTFFLSDQFFGRVFSNEQGVEPLLIVDHASRQHPQRLFLVKYALIGDGENARPILKHELTGYDVKTLLTYPTQVGQLDDLQPVLESFIYGPNEAQLSRVLLQNQSTGAQKVAKAIISEHLVLQLIALYQYAW